MLRVAVACFALVSSVSAVVFTDLNCTDGGTTTTKFVGVATACDDKYSTAACTMIFGVAATAGSGTDRDVKCNTDANGISEEVKQLAISTCPKSCGYCCETPEYDCSNVDYPRVKCSTITQAQCRDPTWRTIIAQDCPSACGFCLTGGCVDTAIECANDPAICRQVDMQAFVKLNCQRTCGYCSTLTTTTVASSSLTCLYAVDANTNCATWIKNGFCTNTFYTLAQRKQYCARSCNLC
ncbi:unnamed protein product [Heligmosomoides polygyrus]|uniref:ShKT domain-containing protein n=1 Tax=Heligmosomoides polygyrus TaxID=6339 RepID=A0A183FQZ3_HELPZ|nr:unnamed protein product [Heligmosomoides polygyrus]